jgi:hypothetical protein
MRKGLWLVLLVMILAMGLVAIPAVAEDPVVESEDETSRDMYVDDDGTRVRVIWMTEDGVVHEWVYYYAEGGEHPVGTALHSVYVPDSIAEPPEGNVWSGPEEMVWDRLSEDGVSERAYGGSYYRMTHPVSPMAVIAKAKQGEVSVETLMTMMALAKPGVVPGWLRNRLAIEGRGDLSELALKARSLGWANHPHGGPPGLLRRNGAGDDDDPENGEGRALGRANAPGQQRSFVPPGLARKNGR